MTDQTNNSQVPRTQTGVSSSGTTGNFDPATEQTVKVATVRNVFDANGNYYYLILILLGLVMSALLITDVALRFDEYHNPAKSHTIEFQRSCLEATVVSIITVEFLSLLLFWIFQVAI